MIEYVCVDDLTDEELEKVRGFNCLAQSCKTCCYLTKDEDCFREGCVDKLLDDEDDIGYENLKISKGPLLKHGIIKE